MEIRGVLIVGGGYAGMHAAQAATAEMQPVTIVDPSGVHDHVTRLAAVAGGSTPTARASTPLETFGHDVIRSKCVGVSDGVVELDDGRTIEAEAVVVSAGARPTQPPIDGIEFAATLRDAQDALSLRALIDTAKRLVVIGGGATGVQLAGASSAAHPDLDVVLVEMTDRLLNPMTKATARGARRILEQRGVSVRLGTGVEEIVERGVVIDGEVVEGIVVWAGGFESRADELGVDVGSNGRILVDDELRVMGMERTFAAGDVAAHLDDEGLLLPMSAQIAVQAGSAAGRNAAGVIDGEELTSPNLSQRGWVLDLGGHRGLAEFGPVTLTGPFADLLPPLLHEAIDIKTVIGMRGVAALPAAVLGSVRS